MDTELVGACERVESPALCSWFDIVLGLKWSVKGDNRISRSMLVTLTSLHLQERANIMRFASFVDGIFRFCVAIELTSCYIHVLHIANQTGPCYTREFEFLKRAKSATYRALSGDMGE